MVSVQRGICDMKLQEETPLRPSRGHGKLAGPEPDARAQASPKPTVRHQIWGPIEIDSDSGSSSSPRSRGSSESLRVVAELLRSRSVTLRDESPSERDVLPRAPAEAHVHTKRMPSASRPSPPPAFAFGSEATTTPSPPKSNEPPATRALFPPEAERPQCLRWGLPAPFPPPWPGGHHVPGRRAQAPVQPGAGRSESESGSSDEEYDEACALDGGEVPYLPDLVSAWSVGSEKHATGNCRVCHYFHTKAGCNNGANCTFCHLSHTRRRPKSRPCKSRRVKCKGMAESLDEVWVQDPDKAHEMASELLNRGNGYLRKVVQSKMRQLHDVEVSTPPDDQGEYQGEYQGE